MNAARPHTDQADDRTESMVETHQTFAAKLRALGYNEPVALPPQPVDPEQLIGAATCTVRNCGQIAQTGATMCRDCSEETEAMARFLDAQREYLRVMAERPTFWSRFRAFLSRIWGGLVLIVCVLLTTLGCVAMAQGVEVPDRVIAAIAQVETGTEWRGIGDVRGSWNRGDIGEVSPWQISPAVLRDLNAYDRRFRVHADPVLAESLVRLWLGRLYERTGCWSQACAAYHAGLAGRHRGYARDYAARVLAIANR